MPRSFKPLEIIVYQDVLCAWCYVADQRLETIRREFGDMLRWRFRPFALRLSDSAPRPRELRDWLAELERARKEPEGANITTDLWLGCDQPRSSIPALAAIEAAALQSADARQLLLRTMHRAALENGINITRPDTALEIASSIGLDMNRFVPAWKSEQTRRLIVQEHRLARSRGVRGVPTLIIGGRWKLSGLRAVSEYREHILTCLQKRGHGDESPSGHAVH
ncbi:MAG: DsbA family protein [Myxococcaceae bacterium]